MPTMRLNRLTTVAVVLLVLCPLGKGVEVWGQTSQGSNAKPLANPAQAKPPRSSEPVRIGDLEVTVRPTADLFMLKEPVRFEIQFTNQAKKPVAVQVTTWFNDTLGSYTYTIRNPTTKKTWKVVTVPLPKGFLGPPTRIAVKQIPPMQTLTTHVSFPIFGLGLRSDTGETFLPAGSYELTVALDLPQGKGTTSPVAFRVSDQEKSVTLLKGLPKEKIAKIAQDYFARRLAVYKKNNQGKPWDTLTVDSFQAKIEAGPASWNITYTATFKESKQRLTMQINVDAAGNVLSVNPGFVFSSTDLPQVPPAKGGS
jgi:hypothetical protein